MASTAVRGEDFEVRINNDRPLQRVELSGSRGRKAAPALKIASLEVAEVAPVLLLRDLATTSLRTPTVIGAQELDPVRS